MRDFETTKLLLNIVSVLGWVITAFGVIGMALMLRSAGLLAFIPLINVLFGGIVLVVFSHIGHAQIATAENTRGILAALEKPEPRVAPAAPPRAGNRLYAGERVKVFNGKEILRTETGVSVDGMPFENVIAAEDWISKQSRGGNGSS